MKPFKDDRVAHYYAVGLVTEFDCSISCHGFSIYRMSP